MSSRSKKTSKRQMETMLDYLENNKSLISGKCHPMNTGELEEKWSELSNILNSVENGSRKDIKQWKTFWYEWKSKTKKKARLHKNELIKTGGGGYISNDLNELENRLMGVLGWIHVTGCPELPEEVVLVEETEQCSDNNQAFNQNVDRDVNVAPSLSEEILLLEQNMTHMPEEQICDNTQPLKEHDITTGASTGANVSSATFVRSTTAPKKSKARKSDCNLQKSAELYSNSTEQMAKSINTMSAAITKLAEAFSDIAFALTKLAEKLDQ